ncbi:MAG: nucleotidyltransferase domain-containing protein [Candidatus Rokuibacteriota bacterium]
MKVYRLLQEAGIETWLQGGWGIDALLGQQTREHKDLDLLIKVDDLARLLRLLDSHGFVLKHTWEENRWVVEDGERVPTAFVVGHDDGRELDFHAVRFDGDDVILPAWSSELALSLADLGGMGLLDGVPVRCYSAEMQLRVHAGYDLPPYQTEDVRRLQDVLRDRAAGAVTDDGGVPSDGTP